MIALFRDQPRSFFMIFMLEIWERFGFYTVQGLLVLYFIRFLGFNETDAYYTFGAFSALVYGLVILGGYLGDNVLGTKRTLFLGLIVLAAGYLDLALVDKQGAFFALSLICVGNGLFKANPSSLLSKSYASNDPRLYSGFTLYYMAINFGAIVALFVGPALSSHYGYSYAYLASFIGIVLGLVNYIYQRKQLDPIDTPFDQHEIVPWQWALILLGIFFLSKCATYLLYHVTLAQNLLWLITACALLIYFFLMSRENLAEKKRMLLALILMVEAVAFFTLYQQFPMSLTLFAVNHIRPEVFSISIDPQSFRVLNGIWIVAMSPVLAKFYVYLNQRGIHFPVPYKFALGMAFCGVGFALLFFCRYLYDAQYMISLGWLVAAYFFESMGELFVSALGVAMIAELVPQKIVGFVMGLWFLTSAVAGFTGAMVSSYTALPTQINPGFDSLMMYSRVFGWIGLVTLLVALFLGLLSKRLTRLMGAVTCL
mgnify:CR=1 FL=1